MKTILCISTAGRGQDSLRMRRLAKGLQAEVEFYDLDRSLSKFAAVQKIWSLLTSKQWDLIYQEGTGIAGGLNLIRAFWAWRQPFIVSSGDPIGGFFYTKYGPIAGAVFGIYERLLYKSCSGFIGWTPYLTGAAMKLGAKRAATIEGAVDLNQFYPFDVERKQALRAQYGIPDNHIVCGMAGSINWVARQSWCQGYELVQMMNYINRNDVTVLIVGDGNGKYRLEELVPDRLKPRIVFTGRVPGEKVADLINIMDIGFVTQIMGKLGNYRLSTKLPEYLACGTAIAMSPIPGFYDYVSSAGWALPAYHPASTDFHVQCAEWLDQLSLEEIKAKKDEAFKVAKESFNYKNITEKFHYFVQQLI